METIGDRVAGLDVHRDTVVACCRLVVGRRVKTVKGTFTTMSAGIAALGEWLVDNQVSTAVMESTGVYWKPVVRHEALFDRVGVEGPHLEAVAAAC